MDASIQVALTILSTITGPSPVLDGLVDQIVTTGLPMVPTLVAASAAQGQPNADATARMLLNGVQRASEHVDAGRKVAIIKGIATHVCPSPVLPWAVRAFAVKALQSMIQQHFANISTEGSVEAVGAAVDAVINIIQTAHVVELAKHLKVSNEAVEKVTSATSPYHNAEIKSAAEFFALLTDIDADTVASVYSPKQKQHLATVAELVKAATEENNNAAAASVAQAVFTRYDPVTLGVPRTIPLRVALEKLNCGVLNDLTKSLGEMKAVESFDKVMSAYPFFFGRNAQQNSNRLQQQQQQQQNGGHADDGAAVAATADCEEGDDVPAAPAAATTSEPSFLDIVKSLITEQSISRDTVCIFLKGQLKDSLARMAADIVAETTAGTAVATAEAFDVWTGRLRALGRSNLLAKAGGPFALSLVELLAALLSLAAMNVGAGDAVVAMVREVEMFTSRSLTAAATEADVTAAHTRISEGLMALLKVLLPPLAPAVAEGAEAAAAEPAAIPAELNLALLEVALLMSLFLAPRPKREVAEEEKKEEVAATDAAAEGADAVEPAAEEGAEAKVGEKRAREGDAEEGAEADADAAPVAEEETAAVAADEAAGPSSSTAEEKTQKKKRTEFTVAYFSDAQRFIAQSTRGAGGYFGALLAAQRVLQDENATVESAKKMKALLGDKTPAEVLASLATEEKAAEKKADAEGDDAAAPSSPFLPVAQIQYRLRVFQNILNVMRIHSGNSRFAMPGPSYAVAAPSHNHNHNHHNNHRGGHNNHHNNNNHHHNHGGDVKRHRHEDNNGRNNQHHNNNSTNHHNNNGRNHHNSNNNHGRNNNNDSYRNNHSNNNSNRNDNHGRNNSNNNDRRRNDRNRR